jgi:hypothetical protein
MKTRYREQKRFLRNSVLVLQVGIETDDTYNYYLLPSLQHIHTCWRDATVEDLTLLEQGDE